MRTWFNQLVVDRLSNCNVLAESDAIVKEAGIVNRTAGMAYFKPGGSAGEPRCPRATLSATGVPIAILSPFSTERLRF